jgi:16S rRNA (adenine1518-N6/adenine1519-N6)-dimethyltransferase
VQPKKRFGQHFLVPAWADKVVEAIAPQPADRFLEIGPGPGVLTSRLAARAAQVTAIEIDRDLAADLRVLLPPTVDVVTADILEVDLNPYLAGGPLRVAGNLPYNISSPILFKLLSSQKRGQPPFPELSETAKRGQPPIPVRENGHSPRFLDATLMLQREVADRLVAAPGTKDYGVLTILTAAYADVDRLLSLPPGAFRPQPKVHSAVVRLRFGAPRVPAELEATLERLVRAIFLQRRKTLGNALRPFAESLGRDPRAALLAAGIDPQARPETLDLPALTRLAAILGSLNSKA